MFTSSRYLQADGQSSLAFDGIWHLRLSFPGFLPSWRGKGSWKPNRGGGCCLLRHSIRPSSGGQPPNPVDLPSLSLKMYMFHTSGPSRSSLPMVSMPWGPSLEPQELPLWKDQGTPWQQGRQRIQGGRIPGPLARTGAGGWGEHLSVARSIWPPTALKLQSTETWLNCFLAPRVTNQPDQIGRASCRERV